MNDTSPMRTVTRSFDAAETSETPGRDLREILAVLFDAKWWIISITAGVALLSAIYAFSAPPTYRANALIQIEETDDSNPFTGLNATLSGLFKTTAPTDAEIKIMTSRSVLVPVVRNLHLNITAKRDCPFIVGCLFADGDSTAVTVTRFQTPDHQRPFILEIGANRTYRLYSPQAHRVLTGAVGKTAVSADGRTKLYVQAMSGPVGASFTLTKLPVPLAAARLGQRLTAVELGKKTGIVRLTLDGSDPQRVEQTLNAIAYQYLKQNVAAKSAQARESLAFINKQLPALKAKLNAAETTLSEYRVKHGTVDINLQANSLLQHNVELQGKLSQLKLKEANLAQRFNPRFPAYTALRRQEAEIKNQLTSIAHQINNLPKQQQQYVRLQRDVNVDNSLYTTLLSKAQDLRVAQAGDVGNVRVVDHAITPVIPIKPKKQLDIALGLMLGLTLGVLAAFLKRMLSVGIRDPDSLQFDFGVPLYAVIPHSKAQASLARRHRKKQATLLVRAKKNDLAVEAMRGLRTSLHISLHGMDRPVLTIGGASPGPGKSFISANLAHLIAESGRRVLLVDADLRRGHLNEYFGIGRTPGLSEILSGKEQINNVVKTDSKLGLDFIAAGSSPPDPSELLLRPKLDEFISEASDRYDAVMLDIPPYLAVSDGLIVARHANVNLLLVHNTENTRHEIAHVMDRLQQNGVHLTGFIYNDFGRSDSNYMYRTCGARYQYRYN